MTNLALAQYAFVTAGVADGIALKELLEYVAIDPAQWRRTVKKVEAQLHSDMHTGLRVPTQLDELQAMARSLWQRRIPPLDEDLRAWLDFQRTLTTHENVGDYLAGLGLSASDLGMLQRSWAERMAADPDLMQQMAAILALPAHPVDLKPAPKPTLPAPGADVGGTGFFTALSGRERDPLPFAGDKEELRLAPPLAAELPPPPKDDDDADGTRAAGLAIIDLGLPFVSSTPQPPEGVLPHPERTVLEATPPAPDPPPPAPATPPLAPPIGTQPLSDLEGTALVATVAPAVNVEPLPFASGPASAPAPITHESPHEQVGETAFTDLSHIDFGPATPFEPKDSDATTPIAHRPLAGAGSLTLAQYAAVETELALAPDNATMVLARYGLNQAGRRNHADALRSLIERDPSAKRAWSQSTAAYRAWRMGGGKQ